MPLDHDKIDDAVLALLTLGLHDGCRVWKGFDWDALDRLHQKGCISDPRSKAKSIYIYDDVIEKAIQLREQLFGKRD